MRNNNPPGDYKDHESIRLLCSEFRNVEDKLHACLAALKQVEAQADELIDALPGNEICRRATVLYLRSDFTPG